MRDKEKSIILARVALEDLKRLTLSTTEAKTVKVSSGSRVASIRISAYSIIDQIAFAILKNELEKQK